MGDRPTFGSENENENKKENQETFRTREQALALRQLGKGQVGSCSRSPPPLKIGW